MKAEGWIVKLISLLANPNQVRPKRFWGVYTKLKIFNMTDYKKGNCFPSLFETVENIPFIRWLMSVYINNPTQSYDDNESCIMI